MECIYQGSMLPLMAGAFQCFSKLNSEVVVLCGTSEVCFQVTGLAYQSFMKFSVDKDSFISYKCGEPFHFGVSSKALVSIFKDIKQVDNVIMKTEQLDIEYNLVFELLCKQKVRKVFRIRYTEAVPNSATYNTEQAVNTVNVRPDLLYKAIQYLQTNDDVIMRVFENSLGFENIPIEGEVRVVSDLAASDVDHISITSPTSLRFMITGLQAVLQFMTTADVKLAQLQFGDGGSVLRVIVKPGNERAGVIIEYLLATTAESELRANQTQLDVSEQPTQGTQYRREATYESQREGGDKRVDVGENERDYWEQQHQEEEDEEEEEWY